MFAIPNHQKDMTRPIKNTLVSVRSLLVLLLVTNCGFPLSASAQSVHLAPIALPALKICDEATQEFCELLTIIAAPDTSNHILKPGSRIRVFNGKLWVFGERGGIRAFTLTGRSIHDIIRELYEAFPGASFISNYPEYDGRYLKHTGPDTLKVGPDGVYGEPYMLQGDLGGSQIHATVGAVFGLSEVEATTTNSRLLSNGGLQLDIVGQVPFSPAFYGRARMTFTSNEPQAVGNITSEDTAPDIPTSPTTPAALESDVSSIITNAERFSMGLLFEWYPMNTSHRRLGFNLEYEIAWNALDDIPLPTFLIAGEERSLFDIYPAERIGDVREDLNQIKPISTLIAGGTFHFPSSNNTSVHLLMNFGVTERIVRELAFVIPESLDDADLPAPETLRQVNSPDKFNGIWRAGLGMSLGSTLDIRADAVGPLTANDFEPLLRIVLSKKFQLR